MRNPFLALALLAVSAAALAGGPPPPLPASYYAKHRAALLARLPEGTVALLRQPDAGDELREAYRPDSGFWWATGFPEPDAAAVLAPGAPEGERYTLFVAGKDPVRELFTGPRAGVEGAKAGYGAGAAFTTDELAKKLPEILRGAKALWISDGGDAPWRERVMEAWRRVTHDAAEPRPVADLAPVLGGLRLVKDAEEIALLRKAVDLSVAAHRAALRAVRPGAWELDVAGVMVGTCMQGGAARMAYPPIVGSGPNSVTLHYERNDRRMEAGEMLVNDTACEYGMYAADVTRSYPVSGKFTPEQRAVYDVVLAAQKAGIAKVRPGAAFHEPWDATVDAVIDGLMKAGVLKGTREEIRKAKSWQALYPHGCSHWLGLDVHDAGAIGAHPVPGDRLSRFFTADAKLPAGAVLTIEPGIYIPKGTKDVDPKWWGIGARIEDDLLVTEGGSECLSCALPREAAELERALAP